MTQCVLPFKVCRQRSVWHDLSTPTPGLQLALHACLLL
jgi:hypothetical protein